MAAAWAELVAQLALGPEPEVRECPVCKHVGMRAATRCGHCWTKLTPPTHDEDEASVTQGHDIGGEGWPTGGVAPRGTGPDGVAG